eukprot:3159413-Prymnesium_polylepis.2
MAAAATAVATVEDSVELAAAPGFRVSEVVATWAVVAVTREVWTAAARVATTAATKGAEAEAVRAAAAVEAVA